MVFASNYWGITKKPYFIGLKNLVLLQQRGLKRIRTAVDGFADRCLTTRL